MTKLPTDLILRRESPFARVSIPNHKNLRTGTLRTILREAGISVEQLANLR
jgi:predicted RNA binding protein YcfA (HicA-like mRNA interferase family)